MTLDLPKSYSNDITKNATKNLNEKKDFYNNNDNSSEISGSEYNDLDDKSFSINSINSGISGTILNSNNNYDENTIVTSSETISTNVVKEVSNIIKSGESIVNSVAW